MKNELARNHKGICDIHAKRSMTKEGNRSTKTKASLGPKKGSNKLGFELHQIECMKGIEKRGGLGDWSRKIK